MTPRDETPEAFALAFDNGMHRFLSVFSGVLTVALGVCSLLLVVVMPPVAVLTGFLVWALARLFVATAFHHRALLVVGREGVGSAETGILLPWSALEDVHAYTSFSGRGTRYRMIEFRLRGDAGEAARTAAATLNRALPTMTLFRRATVVSLCTDTLRDDGEAVLLTAVRRFAPQLATGSRFAAVGVAPAPPGSVMRIWRQAVRSWDGLPDEDPAHPVDDALEALFAVWRPYHLDLLDREALPEAQRADALNRAEEAGIGPLVGMIVPRFAKNAPQVLLGRMGLAVAEGQTVTPVPWPEVEARLAAAHGITVDGHVVLRDDQVPGSSKGLAALLHRLAQVALDPAAGTPAPPDGLVMKGTPAAALEGVKAMLGLMAMIVVLALLLKGCESLAGWLFG